jgi:hypothetical protein
MRIDSMSEVAGVSAIKVRDYLRDVQGYRFGTKNVAYGLKVSVRKARAVMNDQPGAQHQPQVREHLPDTDLRSRARQVRSP